MEIQNQDFSFLGRGSSVEGTFKLSGPTKIASVITGEVVMQGEADLCIEQDGAINGDVQCHNLEIHGQFEGKLNATGTVVAFPTATINGVITAKKFIVYPGAVLNIEGHTTLS